MIKVAVAGVSGRMGGRILSLLQEESEIKVVGATEREGHAVLGKDVGTVAGSGELKVYITDRIDEAAEDADAIIDFTTPDSTLRNAEYASRTRKGMVIGTTGFTEEEKMRLEGLAENFPCVLSPNMSVGVNVMFEVAKRIAELLGEGFDVEIIEAHHRHKADSPSGTALRLGEAVAEATQRNFKEVARFERYGRIGERKRDEIGIQTVRGGDIVGEHTVMYCGIGERIELTHRALNRDNFARGAIRALKWIVGKPPGIYTMKDVLGI
ncbi:MAG TPA: 4-hydroxy-tetrahydrodipicolinate reductase [Thermodesulfobacteriota bacterium]|nr:4-hydroxy-tetrahydrodipicolinate reductase [Thermodesulfobacteriota bacterium]